ncbi:MAG: hypothetical protein UX69_C0004G0026 [candidate division WWE3 bacterium GW2011_GWA2_46_9]|uniref:O-antigen ligase-related domain-containing protein n=1 Tax=candidate division WWE3 bacterium GW2011_GWA2_46_9 TaxID=1619111 RepID=A0A0G1QWB9_UNCKA|nr:MAG: hypothetical protein UX69_C0004G0026 [candidate division WWE3 bacterium GW2011_GWA2_46_9]
MLKYGFYACVFLLSLGQFAVIGRTGLGTMSVSDLAVAAFALAGCAYFLARKRAAVPKYLLAFFVFAFVAMLSLGFNFHKLAFEDFGVAFLYLARFIVYLLGGVVLYNMLRTKMMAPSAILAAFGASAIFVAVVGFIQLVVLPDYSVLDLALGFDPHKNRLGSTFFDPNFTAGYLALVVSLLLGSIRGKKSGAALKLVLALAVLTIAVFLTFSRSGWLMLGVVVFVFGMLRYRWMLLAALLIAFLAYFAVPRVQTRITGATDPADSARFRLISWKNTALVASDNLVTGVGFNAFRFAQKEYGFFDPGSFGGNAGGGSDSSFLLVLATTGVLGFAIFLFAYFYPLLGSAWGSAKSLSLAAALAGLFVHSQFVNSVFFPPMLFLLFSAFAVTNSLFDK